VTAASITRALGAAHLAELRRRRLLVRAAGDTSSHAGRDGRPKAGQ
jgi:hypothetical protein